jgi:hypothetical protein
MENIKEVVINSEEFKKLYEDIIPALNGFVNEYLIPLSRENNQELDNDNVIIYLGNWIHERFKKCNGSESSTAIEPEKEDNRVIASEPERGEIDVIASEHKEKEIHSNKKEGNSINEDSKSNRPKRNMKRKNVIPSDFSSSEEDLKKNKKKRTKKVNEESKKYNVTSSDVSSSEEESKKNKKKKGKKVNEKSKTNNDLESKTKKDIAKESDNAEIFAKELTTYLETKEKEVKDNQELVGLELITQSNELTLETNNNLTSMMTIGSFVLDHLKIEQEINHAEAIQITATKNFYGKLYEGYLMKERQIRHLKSIRNSRHANFLEEFGIDVGTGDTDKQVRNTII